jgi:diguanylate cyclase (GGDEF)-like protein/PAS domain S-box-containing protein
MFISKSSFNFSASKAFVLRSSERTKKKTNIEKTKAHLIREIDELRRKVIELEKDTAEFKRTVEDYKNLAKFPSENPNPVLRLNQEGTILYANDASKALLRGWKCELGGYAPAIWCDLVIEAIKDQSPRTVDVQSGEKVFALDISPIPNTDYANLYGRDITEHKREEDENRRNEARLESLLKISQLRFSSTQELLDFALEEAIALTNSKIGYIYFYDDTKKEFTLNTWSKEVMKQCTIAEPQTVYHLDKTGIWGEAVRQARIIIVNDFQAAHPLKKGYPDGHAPLYKYMTVPVFSSDRIVGVIGIANKETDYDASDVRQLTLLMDSVWKIFERERTEEALRDSEQRYRNLFESMDEGFALCEMIYDEMGKPIDFRYLVVNPAFGKLTGLPVDQVVGRTVKEVIPGIEDFWIESFDRVLRSGHDERFNNPVAELGKEYEAYVWRSEEGRFAVVFSDITERRRAEEVLKTLSLHDDLTGLYNRRGFFALAEQGIKMAQRMGTEMVLIFGDLDNLKEINDNLGHQEGDQALLDISHILKETFRESDIIARIGGDEFVILGMKSYENLPEKLYSRSEKALNDFHLQGNRSYSLSMSLGMVSFDPQNPCSMDDLLAQADRRMYENKQKRKIKNL